MVFIHAYINIHTHTRTHTLIYRTLASYVTPQKGGGLTIDQVGILSWLTRPAAWVRYTTQCESGGAAINHTTRKQGRV